MCIVIYSTGCPKCKVLELKLKQKNIQYKEVTDVEEITKLGIFSVPQLSINGEVLDFGKAINWVNMQEAKK